MSICTYLLSLLLTLCLFHNVCSSCVFHNGTYDLSALDRSTGWPVAGSSINGIRYHYEISLCRPLNYSTSPQKGCSNSSVCLVSDNSAISYGNAIENTSDYAIADNLGSGFSLYVLTNTLCTKGKYRALISFVCGPHLGAPEILLIDDCQVHFYWRTSAACSTKPKNKQVPCYVLDDEGNKRDLSPLIRDSGYFVITPNPLEDFVINVCSDLTEDPKINFPKNASACRIIGTEYVSFGSLSKGLQYTREGLLLSYEMPDSSEYQIPQNCQLKPKTSILFKCPSRGYSQPPKLISNYNCQYEVEWETEYACPENMLKGNIKDCQFTRELHGIEIDLSPLRDKPVYNISDANSSSYYLLSVCGGLGNVSCDGKTWKSMSVCVFNTSTNTSQIGGKTDSAELIYADGEVILRYLKGQMCNGTEQMSVIHFVCDPNAINNGIGEPRPVASDNCSHIFEWPTKHACLKHPLDTPCSVTFDKKTVNLQNLLLTRGAWEALDYSNLKPTNNSLYINVCGQVSKFGNLSKCGEGSSACVVKEGVYLNLGNFTSPPVYDHLSNSVRLHYSGGSPCKENKFWHASIEFICRPGHINYEPVLMRIDETNCHYHFEWQTAEACPVGMIEGLNCKVYNSDLGINYDLTPLKSQVYKIESEQYTFYMGVCESIPNSPCSINKNSSQNVGVCQVDKSNQNSWKTGEPSSRLSYMDGVVNLTYLSGDSYNDQNRTSRMTIIIFICDYKAGDGQPQFKEEVNFAYVFHWYTDLVCSSSILPECIAHDPLSHVLYDLSGLSMSKKNWMTAISDDGKERQVYINVCRSLILQSGCDSSAAACLVEHGTQGEKVNITNLGRALSPPIFERPGQLTLTYTNGDPCTAYGVNTTYSTVIHFLCIEEQMSMPGLRFLSKVGACEYSFLWTTKAACPTEHLQSIDNCQLTDPDSGFTFDLTPLYKAKSPYTIQSPSGGNFQLNVCGKVVEGCLTSDGKQQTNNISVCDVYNNDKNISNIAVSDSYILSYSSGRDLTLTYKSVDKSNNVVIRFPCENSTADTEPKFIHQEDGQYVFEFKTPLSCIVKEFDCNVIDQFGNEYDFSPLAKPFYSQGNWEVSDSRLGYSHLKYHINFCRPLNKVTTYKCPGGATSACQTDFTDPESLGQDLGSQMNEPMVSNKGTVVIRYTGGSPCHKKDFKRSTTINLFCSVTEGELKFMGETEECEYVFSLDTPVACPLMSSQGSNCIVKDPLFGYMFDLNPLKSKNNNYNVTVGEYSYAFNVCDKLNGFSNKCANSSACQLKPKDPAFSKSLGLPNDALVYRKGLISLEYKSGTGSCHGKFNRTTKITFTCHHAHEDKDGPIFISEAQDCTYLFDWPTVHACPPFDLIECSAVDSNGTYYDLSRLSLPNENYYIKNPISDKMTFVINVCRSVIHTPNSLCPYTSAACLVDSSSKDEPVNLGRVTNAPYFEDGKLKISYTSGDHCSEEDTPTARFMQTVIEFSCDPTLRDSEPEFIGKDSCTYYFDWHTIYACPPNDTQSEGNCSVKDPITGHLFDLSSLKNHSVFEYKNTDHQYYLNICGSNGSTPCGANAGMCQAELSGQKRNFTGGKLNSNLTYNNGILSLNYTDGDSCHGGQFQRNTLIEFHCGDGIGEPQFLYESYDCTYVFSWKTELACQPLMHCAIKNESVYYDLTPLAESYHTAASAVPNDDASYYVSVCSSLEMIPGVSCPPGAAICRVSKDLKTSLPVVESLGKLEHPPMIDFVGHPTVLYTNGSTCKRNPDYKNRARIIFLCDAEAGMGEPVLLEQGARCYYLFKWGTSIMCPKNSIDPPAFTSCNYTDNSRGIHFDLLSLQKTGTKPYYEVSGSNTLFKLNVCSPILDANLTHCATAGICGQDGNSVYNYGIATSQKFTYDGRSLRLSFYGGDDCPSGINSKRTSEIIFTCDPLAGMGHPQLYKKYTCLVVFMWKTDLVCQNMQRQCAFNLDDKHYDFHLLSSLTHNWNTSDAKNRYWINLCRGIQHSDDNIGCSHTSAVCMKNNDSYISLGNVQGMQAKSINSTDLLLTFKDGDSRACQSLNSSTPLKVVTRLFMRCGTSLGKPRIFSGPDKQCFYDFVWESSLACADKAEEVMMEKDGIIKDSRLEFSFDINDVLNTTFNVPVSSPGHNYVYIINLSGGVAHNKSDPISTCGKAAICQTKPDNSTFERDVGSFATRKFIVRGSELHLVFTSLTRPCGKNLSKDVTTLINVQCDSSAGNGTPKFLYESGNCDYVFEWDTIVVCPNYHRKQPDNEPQIDHFQDIPESSHKAEIAVGVIFGVIAAMVIVFILVKAERRAIISSRFRSVFGRVSLPYFRYKRSDGERLILVDASKTLYDDDEMLHC